MNLTPLINLAYAKPITATSVIWVDLQHNQHKRHGAHLKRFFCAYRFPMVGCVGASSDAAVLVPAKVNPAQPATLLLDLNHGGSSETHKDIIMPILIVRRAATLKELAEHARIHSAQTCALAETIHTLAADKDEFQDSKHFIQVTSLIWLLLALLEQQEAMCERIESLVFEGDAA